MSTKPSLFPSWADVAARLVAVALHGQQAGLHQRVEQLAQRRQVNRRGLVPVHRLDQRLRKLPAQRRAHLRRARTEGRKGLART